jgi:hypothetical protein
MDYNTLSKAQKRCVDAFVRIKPELATSTIISRTEVEVLFKKLYDLRSKGGEKIGYPMWLVKGQKISRGVYVFPAPGVSEPASATPVLKKEKVTPKFDEEDKQFFTDLKEYGIMETA